MKNFKKVVAFGSATAVAAALLCTAVVNGNKARVEKAKASDYSLLLNNGNAPTLTAGSGNMIDAKGVKWEYSNAASYALGHVSLNHQGYMGVASSSAYGVTGIESITVDFTASGTGELWLLTSVDGTNWYEAEQLTDDTASTAANNWRYVRLFNYDSSSQAININSVTIDYSCSGTSSSDDMDVAADISHVLQVSSNLQSSEETTHFYGADSEKAIRLTNTTETTYGKSHDVKISLGKTYLYSEIKDKSIEFDYYHAEKGGNGSGKPQLKLQKNGNDISGNVTVTDSNYPAGYTDNDSDWWHVAIPVTKLLPTADDSQQINSIRLFDYNIYAASTDDLPDGFTVIDNLRVTSGTPSVSLTSSSIIVNVSESEYIEAAVAGSLKSVTYESDDTSIATVDIDGRIEGVAEGQTTVTATYYVGYNRQVFVEEITVKVSDPSTKYSTGNLAEASKVTILNSAPVTVENVNNEHYGPGIRLTFTGAGTASQYVLRFNLPANVTLKGDNQYATFAMTAKYGITNGSYYYTNGHRYRLTNGGTRVSTDQVQPSNFSPVVSGNDDSFYHYSCTVATFGTASGTNDSTTFDSLELMIRPAANANDTMEFYGVEFGNISDYVLK